MDKGKSEEDMMDAIAVIQEALIDLYLNVKVRSKDEINDYDEDDLMKERENLYMTSPLDLINYIQTSVEILMNIKVEDYITHQKSLERRNKI
jgi:protein associated with RNAse G/E